MNTTGIDDLRAIICEMADLWSLFCSRVRDEGLGSERDRRLTMASMDILLGVGGWVTRDESIFDMLDRWEGE